jgi:hypothetical protein
MHGENVPLDFLNGPSLIIQIMALVYVFHSVFKIQYHNKYRAIAIAVDPKMSSCRHDYT